MSVWDHGGDGEIREKELRKKMNTGKKRNDGVIVCV